MQLFNDENVITTSNDNSVVLTTHRIRYSNSTSLGNSENKTIMLEHITSCEGKQTTNIWYLVFAIVSLIALIIGNLDSHLREMETYRGIGIVLFVVLYFLNRKSYIIISSPSTNIKVLCTGMKREGVYRFIDKVEHAKHERLMSISKHGH